MRYLSFQIENFKGIAKVRVDLARSPASRGHSLVGLNESGKRTILEAINSFSYKRASLGPLELSGYSIDDVHDLIPIAKRSNFNGRTSIKASLELNRSDLQRLAAHLKERQNYQLRVTSTASFTISTEFPFVNS